MTSRGPELIAELERAARADGVGSDGAFDLALSRLLEQAHTDAAPAPGTRATVSERLERLLAGAELGMGSAGSGAATGAVTGKAVEEVAGLAPSAGVTARAGRIASGSTPARWSRHGSKLAFLAAGVAIGFVWGRAPSWQASEAEAPSAVVRTPSPAPIAIAEPPATPRATDAVSGAAPGTAGGDHPDRAAETGDRADSHAETSARAPAPIQRSHAVLRRAAAPRARPHDDADALRVVLEQLRKAQLFLRASEPALALGALDELDARVPAPVLQEERDVTRALALCDKGETKRASELATRVLERAPGSAYAQSLRESCAGREHLLEQMQRRTSNGAP